MTKTESVPEAQVIPPEVPKEPKKEILIDKRFQRLLDQISQIFENSSPIAQREIGKRFEIISNLYEQQKCKNITDFLDAFDASNLPQDLMLFKLVYFNHLYLNPKRRSVEKHESASYHSNTYFGYEDFNVMFAYDYDKVMNPDEVTNKLQHTGWRGSGKSTEQQINTIRAMYYGTRDTIGVMARTIKKSQQLIRNMLTQFVAKEFIDGKPVPTLFSERASGMVLFSKSIKEKDRGNTESAFKGMSLTNGFSLSNGVTLLAYSPEAGGRGANLYNARLNLVHADDCEDAGDAGTAAGEAIWNQMVTFMEADTGNPDDKVIFTVTGNRVNAEEESVFNRFIIAAARDDSYIVRSIPKVDLIDRKSLTIRYTYEEVMKQIRASERPAEITDCPLHTPDMLFPILDMEFRELNELQSIPTWRGIFIDPAFSRTNFSDHTGIIYVYVTKEGKIYFGSKEIKVRGDEISNAIVKEITEHKMMYTFIESGSSESLLRSSVQNELLRMDINTVSFAEEAPRRIKKEDRIKDVFPLWDGTRMGFIKNFEEPLISQLISFDPYLLKAKTRAKGYDALDAFSYALSYIVGHNIATSFDVPQDRKAVSEDYYDDDDLTLAPTY